MLHMEDRYGDNELTMQAILAARSVTFLPEVCITCPWQYHQSSSVILCCWISTHSHLLGNQKYGRVCEVAFVWLITALWCRSRHLALGKHDRCPGQVHLPLQLVLGSVPPLRSHLQRHRPCSRCRCPQGGKILPIRHNSKSLLLFQVSHHIENAKAHIDKQSTWV